MIVAGRADPARFVPHKLYVDSGAVATHRASPYFQTYSRCVRCRLTKDHYHGT